MGQAHTKRELSKSASVKTVAFDFKEEDISFDKLKKIREDIEAKDTKEYFSLKELSSILNSGLKRIENFCERNTVEVTLRYYKKSRRQVNVVSIEDAEFIIRNFK